MKFLLSICLLVSGSAIANCIPPEPCASPAPKVIVRTITKETDKNQSYQKEEQSQNTSDVQTDVKSEATARNGNQTVIIRFPVMQQPAPAVAKPKIITKTVYKTKVKKVMFKRPNRFQLLLGQSKTALDVTDDGCCNFQAHRKYELDVGLQYLRDFDRFTGSFAVTKNQGMYLGVGVNW